MEKLWLLKDKKGRILGPYTREEIVSYISQGRFKGEEFYSSYPAGTWRPISTDSGFYDHILKTINKKEAKEVENKNDAIKSKDIEQGDAESTMVIPIKEVESEKESHKRKQARINIPKSAQNKSEDDEDDYDDEESQIIEMEDVQVNFFKKIVEPLKIPLAIAIAIGAISFAFLHKGTTAKEDQFHLLTVQTKRKDWSLEELKGKLKKAILYYSKDEVSSYLKSQFQLVQILEGNSKDIVSHYYLCLVHLELWPFAYQDTKDRRALDDVLNRINKIDKGGIYSGLCNSARALIDNKYRKALMISDSSLNALNEESPAFFYYLKAKSLKGLGRHNEARNYIQTLYKLLTKWIAPHMLDAQMYYEDHKYAYAIKKYQQVLKIYPKHPSASLRLGVLEYKHLKKINNSEKRLKETLTNLSETISPQILLESYQALVEIYLKQQDKNEALIYAKKAYALNPSDSDLAILITRLGNKAELEKTKIQPRQLIYQGDILVSKGKCEEAQEYYKKAYYSGPKKNALAAIRIAKCLWQLKISSQAIQWLKRSASADPKMVEAYFLLVDYLSSNYDFKRALEILKIARRQNPSSYEILKAYSLLSFRQKQYKTAIDYGERALKFYSSDIEIYVLLNKSYRAMGDYNKAYLYAEQSIEEDVNSIPAQIGYALALGSAYGFSRGETYLKKLMRKFPLIVEYPQALGEYYFEDEKYDKALEIFSFTVKNYPDSKISYMYLGRIHGFLGKRNEDISQYKKAIQHLLKASLLDVSDPEPLFYMGWVYMQNKQYHKAENQYQRVLNLNFNYPLIHYYLGYTNFLQGGDDNLDRALEFSKTESQKNPNLSFAYTLAGDIYKKKALSASNSIDRRRGNYELCAKEYQKAIRLQNKNIKFYVELISCYRGSGDFDSALQIANKIIDGEGTSGYPEIYRQVGGIYEAKGDYRKAQLTYKIYFALMPSAPDKKTIERRLEGYILKEEEPVKKK